MNATSALRQSWIIMLRDLKHWQREPWTPLFGIAFTIMLVLVFGYLFGGSIELPGGGDYLSYLMPGMFALAMMQLAGRTGSGNREQGAKLLAAAAKLGHALGLGVGVEPALDGLDGGELGGGGHVEVGQADREVDRVLHGPGHVERLADARGVDVPHPVGDPGVVHGGALRVRRASEGIV